MNKDKLKKLAIIFGVAIITFVIVYFSSVETIKLVNKSNNVKNESVKPISKEENSFNTKIIKEINKKEENNYLISPYSIEYVLSMLRDGADGNTKKELDNLIGNRDINYLGVKGRVNVANGLFVRDIYKNKVLSSYYDTLKSKYKSEIIYDDFNSPDVINNWVNKETYEMIPKIIDKIPSNMKLLIVNALAIDVEWKYKFECSSTTKEEFTKVDGSKYEVSMMNNSYKSGVKYFDIDGSKGVILPYKSYDSEGNEIENSDSNLEFIGILPDNNVKDYVNNLSDDILNKIDKNAIDTSSDVMLSLSLPSFNYNYDVDNLISYLQELGVNDIFNENSANLSGIGIDNLYVSKMIQKTYISLKEEGTRAAAATGMMAGTTSVGKGSKKIIKIEFNKPFIYVIRNKKTNEMLFFGVIYEPNKWEGSTCK